MACASIRGGRRRTTRSARRRATRGTVVLAFVSLLASACGASAAVTDNSDGAGPSSTPAISPTTVDRSPSTNDGASADDGARTSGDVAGDAGSATGAAGGGTLAVGGLDGATPYAVAADGDVLVAVGTGVDGAAAWTSEDASQWRPARVDAGDVPRLRAVAPAAGRWVAFGGDDLAPSAVWTSDNAAVWQPADGAAGVDGRVNALATHRGSWFAVGERVDAEGGGAAVGVVWRSDDGTDWTTVADDLAVGDGTVSDVAVRDDTMVVVGFGVADGLMWTGPIDGPLRPVDGSAFAQSAIQGVAATDAGFVAVGRGLGDLRPYVWRSVDGDRWTRTALDDDVFPPDDAIHDLAAVDGGLLAVGASPDGGVVWTSDDGDTWTRAD